jgi:Fur family iron response transcriptional regulator
MMPGKSGSPPDCEQKRARVRAIADSPAEAGVVADGDSLDGRPVHELRAKLRQARLRPTRQRLALGWLLFGKGDRHVTAETLFEEAKAVKAPVSLATIYNTLHQFTGAGLLREIAIDGPSAFFDTNASPHQHFLIEETGALIDIPDGDVALAQLPKSPVGGEIARIDVVVRIRRAGGSATQNGG